MMGTNSIVAVFAMIAVHAKDLEPLRVSSVLKPFVKPCASRKANFFSVVSTVVGGVVERHKKGFGFSTAGADITAICGNGLILQSVVVSESVFVSSLGVVFNPFVYFGNYFFLVSLVVALSFLAKMFSGSLVPFFNLNGATFLAHASSPFNGYNLEIGAGLFLSATAAFLHNTPSFGVIIPRFDYESQEGVTTIPQGSRAKRPEAHSTLSRRGDEIVCSARRLAAALRGGCGVANHSEHKDGNQLGVAAGSIFGVKKSVFNSKDFGVFACDTYAAAH